MRWSLYNKEKYLEPLIFSNGKSQLDVVNETIKAINEGHKIIFIKGACGTGKSAIALNLAKELGRTSIVVPSKPLQKQYEDDYTNRLYILKDNGEKLDISVIDGRNNHKCIFKEDSMADDKFLPCDIEIKEINKELIQNYIKENPFVKIEDFESINDVRRKSIAPACPYWSPITSKDWFENGYILEDAKEIEYKGLGNKTFTYHKRKDGCGYYKQFMGYVNSDVIIFNSKKYELENVMDRKPATEIEIIDECDEFLDSLSNEKRINLNRLSRSLAEIKTDDFDLKELTIEINDLIVGLLNDKIILDSIKSNEIFLIKETRILSLLRYFLDNPKLIDLTEDESSDYLYNIYQIGKAFEDFFDETYLTFYKNDYDDLIVNLITVNLEKKLSEFLDKNKVFVMMSGTIHSELVLKNVFGIKEFKIIEAEANPGGKITKVMSRLEKNFDYITLKQNGSRELYLRALSKSIELAEKPILIHVNAFSDLPTGEECLKYKIDNIKTRKELKDEQNKFKRGELVKDFKDGKIETLYSTKCTRGVDFPGNLCNSIIFTKYPNPDISSLFWKVMKKSKPKYFQIFYVDKAKRELLQRIYRGLRSKDDHIKLLSPDLRVLNGIK
ncbi:DEAD/DEAH box helicase family protein [Candidatus Woesearchaeota archaeon]|nr:DEAD/DEAH box helicase family protein [Candidatus Woesearchaeota archaeon]